MASAGIVRQNFSRMWVSQHSKEKRFPRSFSMNQICSKCGSDMVALPIDNQTTSCPSQVATCSSCNHIDYNLPSVVATTVPFTSVPLGPVTQTPINNTPKLFAVSVACGRPSPTNPNQTDVYHLLGFSQSGSAIEAKQGYIALLEKSHPTSDGWKGHHAVAQEISFAFTLTPTHPDIPQQ
jgi:hypothetical protein